MDNFIPVAFITDENYVMPACVSIVSLIENSKNNTKYKIYVLTNNVSQEAKQKLSRISLKNSKLEIIDCSDFCKKGLNVNKERHVTKTSILKFFLADIINEPKLLFLDCDTLIRDDLSAMFNEDVSDCYAAAVKDILTERGYLYHFEKLGFKNEFYFNSGVMLLNLNKMREEKISKKLMDYRQNEYNYFMDQDAFNMVIGKNIKYLSYKYNFLNLYFDWWNIEKLADFFKEEFKKNKNAVYKSLKIIHFGGIDKPWEFDMGLLSKEFMHYYNVSPYASEKLNLKRTPDYLKGIHYLFSVFKYRNWLIIVLFGILIKIKTEEGNIKNG